METEHSANDRMHRLLAGVLDDVEFDTDVVPDVLAGYDRGVKARRYRVAGTAVAVLAVAATAVSVLPRSGHGSPGPTAPTTPTAAKRTGQDLDFQNSGCHQHWVRSYTNIKYGDGGPVSDHLATDDANCRALTTALRSVFPDATLTPRYSANLHLDPRIDQEQLKQYLSKLSPSAAHSPMPVFPPQLAAESEYLATHPEDPANVADPSTYTLITPAGRERVALAYSAEAAMPAGSDLKCAKASADFNASSGCVPLGSADGWHGALHFNVDASPGAAYRMEASLADGHGHYVTLTASGVDTDAWRLPAAGGTFDPKTARWTNRLTGQQYVGGQPPKTPALNAEQYARLYNSKAFQSFLNQYASYQQSLPTMQGSPTSTPPWVPAG
ncbi:MAG: hypothetical protein JF587_08940 [Catenulisporales bacterium]|nr:hypothetical protein [Catenulisporales bacterium]